MILIIQHNFNGGYDNSLKINNFEKMFDMTIEIQKRQQILRKVYRVPADKLSELDDFISKFDLDSHKKSKNLSFAGAWQNLDESVFAELTDNLIANRKKNIRRNHE
jgi:hypothetical protein